MAEKNKNLIIAVALIGGFVAWEWYKGKQTTTTTTTTSDLAGGGTTDQTGTTVATANTPVETISNAVQAQIPATGPIDISGNPLPAGISQDVYNEVYTWATSDGRQPVLAMRDALMPSEYNGMYDIITTQWEAGASASLAQQKFWNDLRSKYDPHHNQW